jgi:hypothetical protein
MNSSSRLPRFAEIAAPLSAAGLPLPIPLQWALNGDPQPLALSTRTAWPQWAQANGYTADQIQILEQCVAPLRLSNNYLQALAADLSERYDVDGKAVEAVTPLDRHSAALMLHVRSLGKTTPPRPPKEEAVPIAPPKAQPSNPQSAPPKAQPSNPQSAPPDSPAPSKPQPTKSRETIHLNGLSPEEIERRRVALAAAGSR